MYVVHSAWIGNPTIPVIIATRQPSSISHDIIMIVTSLEINFLQLLSSCS